MRTTHQKKTKEKKYLLGRLCQLASTRSTIMRTTHQKKKRKKNTCLGVCASLLVRAAL
jgi:hypothetical protein